jgi:YidC/Oxa1 family membrane protein insertase
MDKQTTLGFILIGLVLIVWMWVQTPSPSARPPQQPPHDTTRVAAPSAATPQEHAGSSVPPQASGDSLGKFFGTFQSGEERVLIIKTDLYTAEISSKGGVIRKWELAKYKSWDHQPAQLLDFDKGGDLNLLFTSADGKLVNTKRLYFASTFKPWQTVELHGEESYEVVLALPVAEGKSIEKRFVFQNGKYTFGANFIFRNVQDIVSNYEYQIVWENGIRSLERNSVDDAQASKGYAYSGGELIDIDATSEKEPVERDITGSTDWVATSGRYFGLAILSENGKGQGAYLKGVHLSQPNRGVHEVYTLAMKVPLKSATDTSRFTVFLGPLDFGVIKSIGRHLDQIMSLGAAWIIRPIAEYVMIPLFHFLHLFIPNFGVVIIVFSIIIKLALHPLSRTSLKSMKKMQALQPMMTEIREKYKDEPEKMNRAVMDLYKDYGVNPAAGCLPMLLQMPILFALYSVFRSSIELRQAAFVGWISDLSIPDVIAHLPFSIPIFGITEVSGLALAMGVTMFLQQKMTVTDPRQKAMVWMMPVMMTLLFNGFPSGLNLYYFVFNILSIGQQMWVNKQSGDEPLRKVERKGKKPGLMERLTKDLPKLKQ